MTLETIAREIRTCTLCPLAGTRNMAVPGEGPAPAGLMLIGEAPGKEEDMQGRPFVGRAGKVLDQALMAAGIARGDVFITSVVKCRPPNNRTPIKHELDTCMTAYLSRQMQIVDPEIVCLLGLTAAKALLGTVRMKAARGRVVEEDRKYLVTYHPAAAGRNPAWREDFEADIKLLERLLTKRTPSLS